MKSLNGKTNRMVYRDGKWQKIDSFIDFCARITIDSETLTKLIALIDKRNQQPLHVQRRD